LGSEKLRDASKPQQNRRALVVIVGRRVNIAIGGKRQTFDLFFDFPIRSEKKWDKIKRAAFDRQGRCLIGRSTWLRREVKRCYPFDASLATLTVAN
jgi:hypothetical protein